MILDLLAAGITFEEILEDYPDLEREDFQACPFFAVKLMKSISTSVKAKHSALTILIG